MNYADCTITTKNSTIPVKENKSKLEVSNPNRLPVQKIKVDGCLISDNQEKCDWIIALEIPSPKAFFVELKGCNLDKAISQLKATLTATKAKFKNHDKSCYAVTTRIPKHGPDMRKRCIDFHKETNSTLSVRNKIIKISL